ncbi:MAG: GNAT family N-acetyltransferase [Planctomycetota bacterium]
MKVIEPIESDVVEAGSPETVRPARMLLPAAMHPTTVERFWVARDEERRIVGAAAVSRLWSGGEDAGPSAELAVLEGFRGRGLGRVLLGNVVSHARTLGAKGLHGRAAYAEDSTELQAARSMGFDRGVAAMEVTLDARDVAGECQHVLDRLRQRGRVPAGVVARPLCEVDEALLDEVAEQQRVEVGGDAADVRRRLGRIDPDAFDLDVSVAVTDAEGLVGFGLVHVPARDVAATVMESVVVLPRARRGWANAMLKEKVATQFVAKGGTTFQMMTFDTHRDTRRQGERLAAVKTRTLVRPTMLLA